MTNATAEDRAAPLPAGTQAPDFELPSTPDQTVSLAEFRGRPVILVFYPEDWSPVCSDQLALYQQLLPEFQKFDAELARASRSTGSGAISRSRRIGTCTSRCSPTSSPRARSLGAYQVYRAEDGTSERALFVIDRRRHRALELRLSGRRQPRRRRDPARARGPRDGGRRHEHDPVGGGADPAGQRGARPHPGPGGRAGDARRVRRLRVSVLRRRVSDHQGRCRRGWATGSDSCSATSRSRLRIRTPSRRRRPPRPRPRRARSGRCTTSSTRISSASSDRPASYAEQLGLDGHGSTRSWREHAHAERVREDFMSGVRSGVNGTPTFYINGARHDGATSSRPCSTRSNAPQRESDVALPLEPPERERAPDRREVVRAETMRERDREGGRLVDADGDETGGQARLRRSDTARHRDEARRVRSPPC